MDDYISRQAAREFVCVFCVAHDICNRKGNCNITTVFDDIPPADVRPVVRGHWAWNEDGIDWNIGAWCCSECGCKPETWWEGMKNVLPLRCAGSKFCGHCGADMRGVKDVKAC